MTIRAAPSLLVFRDPPLDGPTNMARDDHLLHSASLHPAALRLYGWNPPTISLGYFQRVDSLARLPDPLRKLAIVRRATGGGAILHDREVTYCLVVDQTVAAARKAPAALYRLVHECWREALLAGGWHAELAPDDWPLHSPRGSEFFCFERPGRTDLLLGGGKLLGSAQRRIPGRVLQHGSLLLERRFPDHPGAALGADAPATARVCDQFVQRVAAALDLEPQPRAWRPDELADVGVRRETFAADAWTRRY